MTTREAQVLAKECIPSPFGKNYDTIVDRNVRNTLQLEPQKVSFSNPQWKKGLEKLLKRIQEEMKLTGIDVVLKVYKLLLYGPGGHFAMHKDTEKEEGMFATLVIQLPSAHTGGALKVEHAGEDV